MSRARASVVGLRTDKGENSENPDGCKFRKHDDAMRMMTWQDATRKQMTKQQQRITGGQLAHRSRGVTGTPRSEVQCHSSSRFQSHCLSSSRYFNTASSSSSI